MIKDLFNDEVWRIKIQKNLPFLFQKAETEASRNGKIGMEIGSVREKIIIKMLMAYFGRENINTNIAITESEIDVGICNKFFSIKTVTTNRKRPNPKVKGFKLKWCCDQELMWEFRRKYIPEFDILYAHINWKNNGGLYLFSKEIQLEILNIFGRDKYIKIPKEGTDSRGPEISNDAVRKLAVHKGTKIIPIQWNRQKLNIDIYEGYEKDWE